MRLDIGLDMFSLDRVGLELVGFDWVKLDMDATIRLVAISKCQDNKI